MNLRVWLAALIVTGLSMIFASCGGGDGNSDEAVNLTGVWDMIDMSTKSSADMTLIQNGNALSGNLESVLTISGQVTDNLVSFSGTFGPTTATFTGTLSDNGNSMVGTVVGVANTTGAFNAVRRGTGDGVDLTGSWLSLDLETSASLAMQIVQSGNKLSGTPQGATSSLQGTVNGSEVTFMAQVGGKLITWTGNLSFDGNTVTGDWLNTATTDVGGWRMTRQ